MTRKELEDKGHEFLEKLFSTLEVHRIAVDTFHLDHICWRVDSILEFDKLESTLLQYGTLFHKSIHNGRPISLITLDAPIRFRGREISLLELPSPKAGKAFPNGFEHAEFVVSDGLENLIASYPKQHWIEKNINKPINPDVKLQFDKFSVKFHPYTLEHVVKNLE